MTTARLKVMTILGTRPEIIRLSRVIPALDRHFDHILVHTGQNYDHELNRIFFDEMRLREPDYVLDAAGDSAAETIGRIIMTIDPILAREKPDALLVLGDTNSSLAVIPAKRRHIPIFHMEAGNRCFDQCVPEETNRRIVDHVADINLPYSAIARAYLLAEGIPADRIVKTGSPMREVIEHFRADIESSDVLDRLELRPGHYFLISCHREENVDDDRRLSMLAETLARIAEKYAEPILFSVHPRTRKRIEALDIVFHDCVRLVKPLGFLDYNALQLHAHAVLSDSGTISEEATILDFPALNLRDAHERPEAMEEAAVMMTGLSPDRVLQGLAMLEAGTIGTSLPVDYETMNVSEKVARIILSHTDYVRHTVWHEV